MVGDAGAGAWYPQLAADELPVAVPGRRMLVHTATVAVWLSEVHVYTGGVQFALEARCRERGAVCDPVADPGGVLLGMVDADGTVASTLPGRSGLRCLGGGPGPAGGVVRYLLQPLPAPGPLAVYLAWPRLAVPETRVELEATAVVEAAARVRPLWPRGQGPARTPDGHGPGPRPVGSSVPSGGWFATVAAQLPP